MASTEPDPAQRSASHAHPSTPRRIQRWVATLLGGVAAVTGGMSGCLMVIVILLAPLLLFVLLFGQGVLGIVER